MGGLYGIWRRRRVGRLSAVSEWPVECGTYFVRKTMASVLKGDVIRMVFYPSARDRRRQFGHIRTAAFDRFGQMCNLP